ncbi:hypothetical protein H6G93_12110 [Nostoc sp. FACHB-973]|nr:hypothetical protein [Nostoc sp. FACHB-973]MBX9258896.1 hypothetical protein [Desmonostoc muscorum CCALA 125]
MFLRNKVFDACWQGDSGRYVPGIKSLFQLRNLLWKSAASFFNVRLSELAQKAAIASK